jgi:hypothetical protein
MHELMTILVAEVRHRWRLARQHPDAGYSTETVLVTALLVAAALVVLAIITAKVVAKAKSIDLG